MVESGTLTVDAQAIILACSSIGLPRGDETKPFGPRGWAKLSARLNAPGSMLGLSAADLAVLLGDGDADADRLARLLARSGQLAFELDRLRSRGTDRADCTPSE